VSATDKYGDGDFDVVPMGPRKGDRWVQVPALTLHAILSSVEFGLVEIDERRVVAIREGLRAKDQLNVRSGT
jgi:hypothetical protein